MQPRAAAISSSPALEQLEDYLKGSIAVQASEIDQSADALGQAFAGLGARSLLTLRVSPDWGGHGLSPSDYWQAQRLLARYSGSLAFLQTQHQSAANFIANGSNAALKSAHLSAMATGARGIGVGFSHLRRSGAPCLTAAVTAGGYVLNGSIPWATGWGYFSHLVAGAIVENSGLEGSSHLLCLLPFGDQANPSGDRLHCSAPMALAALGVTQTVSSTLKDYFVPTDQVIDLKPGDWLQQSDRRNVLKATSFLIGCSEAALDVMHQQLVRQQLRQNSPLGQTWDKLNRAVQHQTTAIQGAMAAAAPFEQQLTLRAEAIALCHRCAQAAVQASGGAANMLSHPAQRIYREALVFGVSGQTAALRAASLEALSVDLP